MASMPPKISLSAESPVRGEDLGTFDQPWSEHRMCEIGLRLGQIADRVRLGDGAAPQTCDLRKMNHIQ